MRRPLLIAIACCCAAGAQADSSCKPLLESMSKYLDTSSHMVTTTTRGPGSKPAVGETIHAGSQRYLLYQGKWMVSRMGADFMRQQSEENAAKSTCRMLREESVNGEPSVVFEVKRNDEAAASRGEYYISRRSGLPVKEELDIGAAGDAVRTHLSVRVDYQNVQAPALGK